MKMIGFVLGLLGYLVICGCGAQSDDVALNAAVTFRGNLLRIENNDDFFYDHMKVRLNDGKFIKEFSVSIPPRDHVKCNLSDFTRSDGERFNILVYSPVDVVISCEVSKKVNGQWQRFGRGFFYGKFR
jgi:hypothetical protein